MKNFFRTKKLNIICSFAALAVICTVWIIAYYAVANDYIVPSLTASLKSLLKLFAERLFWTSFGFSLLRTLEAFALSFVLAAFLAALSACSKVASAIIKPIMAVLRALPTLAVILILLIWTSPKTAPVIVTVLVLFPMIYAQMLAALGDVDCGLIEMAGVYEVKKSDRLFKIYLPLISPNILSQTGANISLGLKIMVSAEVLASTYKSLGGLMQNAKLYLDMPRLAALTISAVLAGLIIEAVLSLICRHIFRWSKREAV